MFVLVEKCGTWLFGVSYIALLPWTVDSMINGAIDLIQYGFFTLVYASLLWRMVEDEESELAENDPIWHPFHSLKKYNLFQGRPRGNAMSEQDPPDSEEADEYKGEGGGE